MREDVSVQWEFGDEDEWSVDVHTIFGAQSLGRFSFDGIGIDD